MALMHLLYLELYERFLVTLQCVHSALDLTRLSCNADVKSACIKQLVLFDKF